MPPSPIDTLRRAVALYEARKLEEASALCETLVTLPRVPPDAYHLGGLIAFERGEHERGIELLQKAVDAGIRNAAVYSNLAICLAATGRISKAHEYATAALSIPPPNALANAAAADVFQAMGALGETITHLRTALLLEPSPPIHSNLLYALNFVPGYKQAELCAEARKFDHFYGHPTQTLGEPRQDKDPERKLRIGYLSADMYSHSVAHFLEPLFKAHDRNAFFVHAFPSVKRPDAITRRLQGLADAWTPVHGLSDLETARAIRNAGIDILVELGGHTGEARLLVLAYRPAPIQISYLGYPNTTGLAACGYRFTDALVDPENEPASDYVETLIRLQGGFLCYEPPEGAPEVSPLPALTSGGITFGSFNTLAKMTPKVVELWARIVRKSEGSRLLLKAGPLADAGVRDKVKKQFADLGLDPSRLVLEGRTPGQLGHLARYADVDIALDPFPYSGTTTTCEALFMGVPVVALSGDRHASRVSASLLKRVGLESLVAMTPKQYQQIALDLALPAKRTKLAERRAGLRASLLGSPLCDKIRYAREVEAAYRALFRSFCGPTKEQ